MNFQKYRYFQIRAPRTASTRGLARGRRADVGSGEDVAGGRRERPRMLADALGGPRVSGIIIKPRCKPPQAILLVLGRIFAIRFFIEECDLFDRLYEMRSVNLLFSASCENVMRSWGAVDTISIQFSQKRQVPKELTDAVRSAL